MLPRFATLGISQESATCARVNPVRKSSPGLAKPEWRIPSLITTERTKFPYENSSNETTFDLLPQSIPSITGSFNANTMCRFFLYIFGLFFSKLGLLLCFFNYFFKRYELNETSGAIYEISEDTHKDMRTKNLQIYYCLWMPYYGVPELIMFYGVSSMWFWILTTFHLSRDLIAVGSLPLYIVFSFFSPNFHSSSFGYAILKLKYLTVFSTSICRTVDSITAWKSVVGNHLWI